MNKKDISIPFIRFNSIADIESIIEFTNAKNYTYDSEYEILIIDNGYEKVKIWLGGYVIMMYNKAVFLTESYFNKL